MTSLRFVQDRRRRENLPCSQFPGNLVIAEAVICGQFKDFPDDGRGLLVDLKNMFILLRLAVSIRRAGRDELAVFSFGFQRLTGLS